MFGWLKPKRVPVAGERWYFKDKSPWPTKDGVRILDCKDGWVRYAMGLNGGTIFQDNRMDLPSFRYIYTPGEGQ